MKKGLVIGLILVVAIAGILYRVLEFQYIDTSGDQEKMKWIGDQYRQYCPSCAWIADNGFENGCDDAGDLRSQCMAAIEQCNRCAERFIVT